MVKCTAVSSRLPYSGDARGGATAQADGSGLWAPARQGSGGCSAQAVRWPRPHLHTHAPTHTSVAQNPPAAPPSPLAGASTPARRECLEELCAQAGAQRHVERHLEAEVGRRALGAARDRHDVRRGLLRARELDLGVDKRRRPARHPPLEPDLSERDNERVLTRRRLLGLARLLALRAALRHEPPSKLPSDRRGGPSQRTHEARAQRWDDAAGGIPPPLSRVPSPASPRLHPLSR
eukprot:2818754-Prymnesium_polylepis.2